MNTSTTEAPKQSSYDIVIVGGAIMGSSAAWFLTENKDFNGRVPVSYTHLTLPTILLV